MKKNNDIFDMMDAWDDNAENFRGTVLDENKMMLLNMMKSYARDIADASGGELRFVDYPFDNHDRTASVILRGPSPILLMSTRAVKIIGTLCSMADTLSMAKVEGTNEIQMCFTICEMWKEWRMENSPFGKK